MTATGVPTRHHDANAPAYERLRRQALADSPGGGRFGLVVLLREGVAAWIADGIAITEIAENRPAATPSPGSLSRSLSDARELHAGIVGLLANMALANTGEMRQ